jgi:hypothetical protein
MGSQGYGSGYVRFYRLAKAAGLSQNLLPVLTQRDGEDLVLQELFRTDVG